MLPRDDFGKLRLSAKVRREMSENDLVHLLNGEYKTFRKTVDPQTCIKAFAIISQFKGARSVFPHGAKIIRSETYDDHLPKLLMRLNFLLRQFPSTPCIELIGADGVWYRGRVGPRDKFAEECAISKMIDMAEAGKLHRLKTCQNKSCSRWFYARLPNKQACCSKSCGDKFSASNEEKRRVRNARRRQNRAAEAKRAKVQMAAKPWPDKWTTRPKGQSSS